MHICTYSVRMELESINSLRPRINSTLPSFLICPEKHIDLEQYLSVKKTFSAGKRGNFQRWKNCLNYFGYRNVWKK